MKSLIEELKQSGEWDSASKPASKKTKKGWKDYLKTASDISGKFLKGASELTINPLGRALTRPFVTTYQGTKSIITGKEENKAVSTPFGKVKPLGFSGDSMKPKEALGEAGYLGTLALGMKPSGMGFKATEQTVMDSIIQRTPVFNKIVKAVEKLPVLGGVGETATASLGALYGASYEAMQNKSNSDIAKGALYGTILSLGIHKTFQGLGYVAGKLQKADIGKKSRELLGDVQEKGENIMKYKNRAGKEILGSFAGKDPELFQNIKAAKGSKIVQEAFQGDENAVAYKYASDMYNDFGQAKILKQGEYAAEKIRLQQNGIWDAPGVESAEMINQKINEVLKKYDSRLVQEQLELAINRINENPLNSNGSINELRQEISGMMGKDKTVNSALSKINTILKGSMSPEMNLLNGKYAEIDIVNSMLKRFQNSAGKIDVDKAKKFLTMVVRQKQLGKISEIEAIGQIIGKDLITDTKALFSLLDVINAYGAQGIKSMIQNVLRKAAVYTIIK